MQTGNAGCGLVLQPQIVPCLRLADFFYLWFNKSVQDGLYRPFWRQPSSAVLWSVAKRPWELRSMS
eukprot:1158639-Pelagomonas_calceolata.AAC.2